MFLETYFSEGSANSTPVRLGVDGQPYTIKGYEWPTHLVYYDNPRLSRALRPKLIKHQYQEVIYLIAKFKCARFFNTHFHDDEKQKGDVVVACRTTNAPDLIK
jgi:hypothetical protein